MVESLCLSVAAYVAVIVVSPMPTAVIVVPLTVATLGLLEV